MNITKADVLREVRAYEREIPIRMDYDAKRAQGKLEEMMVLQSVREELDRMFTGDSIALDDIRIPKDADNKVKDELAHLIASVAAGKDVTAIRRQQPSVDGQINLEAMALLPKKIAEYKSKLLTQSGLDTTPPSSSAPPQS